LSKAGVIKTSAHDNDATKKLEKFRGQRESIDTNRIQPKFSSNTQIKKPAATAGGKADAKPGKGEALLGHSGEKKVGHSRASSNSSFKQFLQRPQKMEQQEMELEGRSVERERKESLFELEFDEPAVEQPTKPKQKIVAPSNSFKQRVLTHNRSARQLITTSQNNIADKKVSTNATGTVSTSKFASKVGHKRQITSTAGPSSSQSSLTRVKHASSFGTPLRSERSLKQPATQIK